MGTRPLLACLLLSLSVAGCSLVTTLFEPSAGEQQAAANAAAEHQRIAQERADREIQAELERLRQVAETSSSLDATLEYAIAVCEAHESGAVARGIVSADSAARAEAMLAEYQSTSEDPDDGGALEQDRLVLGVQGRLYAATGRVDEASAAWLLALESGGELELFDALASLSRTPTTDAAVLRGCSHVRAKISGPVHEFVGVCLARADGDPTELAWSSAGEDVRAYEQELARLEAVAVAEAELALAAEQGLRAALGASVFAAGRCRFSKCATEGWDTSLPDGDTAQTRCRFSKCLEEGWDTSLPGGDTAQTRCRFSKCLEEGWDTSLPSGDTAQTRCRFSKCATEGWDTSLPDGSTATTRCRFSDCFKEGWDTSLPDGSSMRCTCRFQNCLEEGTECS